MQRVDVHHHYLPPFYAQALQSGGGDPSGWSIPEWTVEKDLEFDEQEGISFSFLSITAPGPEVVPPKDQSQFCRRANEYAAALCAKYPNRYGFFATVPSLLDPASASQEITYALDKLHADGITVYTRYGLDNHYLGHPDFQAIWDLLDSRGAVVFVHPTHPVETAFVNPSLPQPMIDYPHETTRAAVDLITSGSLRAHPNVKIILSHAGGTLPYLALRPAVMLPCLGSSSPAASLTTTDGHRHQATYEELVDDWIKDAQSFYFDTALSAAPATLQLLKDFAQPGHVLFGSDYPYAPSPAIRKMDGLLDTLGMKKEEQAFVESVNYKASLKLFPRLAGLVGDDTSVAGEVC